MSVSSLRLGIFHHPQKSFRLDQKYFETFIILEYRLASVYRCCYGNFGAWNFANHVQKHKSYKIDERKMGCKRGRASEKEREGYFSVYRSHFLATEIISMAKLQQSNYYMDVEVFVRMDVENAIRMPQQDCVRSLPEVSV